jgi:hypothetical protein
MYKPGGCLGKPLHKNPIIPSGVRAVFWLPSGLGPPDRGRVAVGRSSFVSTHLYPAPQHVGLTHAAWWPAEAILGALRGDLCKILQTDFHEKALFVKPTWRLLAVERNDSVSFAMLPSALSVSPLFGDSVHYEILLFGLLEDAAIFGAVSPPRGGRAKFVLRSRLTLEIRSDRAHGNHTARSRRALSGSSPPALLLRLRSFL